MKIKDLHGKSIEVTDLDKAIWQAENFKEYAHEDQSFLSYDKKQKAYWTDIYNKLLQLKKYPNEHIIGNDSL
ncbi:hypothetical protein [Chryseobacterium sp. JK1]|uniref:hypothetical protein n=1 Tax=Chryseobacterium sp. JK1 TaxID=874294 RepID=UPI003D689E62